ncbi:glucose 1-dehydrogenase [Candidatus Bathyarchaeota archaeon]|nr:glucose 1-dehydrogenase [Candidatus Bathyarchaeota archaeon]
MSKVAIVTGAGRGIGRGIALKLAKELDYNIVVVDIDEESASSVAQEIKNVGKDAIAVKCDVSNNEDVERMVEKSFEFGEVDAVVNNAGITRDSLLLKMSEKDWDMVLNINLKALFLINKAVCSKWVSECKKIAEDLGEDRPAPSAYPKRKIVNISSIVAKGGNVGQANYVSSKAGVIGLTKTIAKEMSRYNVNCNAVQPGFIKTPMTDKMPEKIINKFIAAIPLQRMGLPEDIAGSVKFLCSPDSDYITGFSIEVDGGLDM